MFSSPLPPSLVQDDQLSYEEVMEEFDVLMESPITDFGQSIHEELWHTNTHSLSHTDYRTVHFNSCQL